MAELITDWNMIIDYKITEKDLNQPTFDFFYNALESILLKLNVDINKIKESVPENDFERMYKNAFAQNVNWLYKLSSPTFNFFYLDLIKPNKKKCTHVLKNLLNYLHYVEMVQNEIATQAENVLYEHDDALSKRNELQKTNQIIEEQIRNMDVQLAYYEDNIPERQNAIKEMGNKLKTLAEDTLKLNEEAKAFDALLMNLQIKLTDIQQKVVRDEEFEGLQRTLDELKIKLNEIRKACQTSQEQLHSEEISIKEMQDCVDLIENISSAQSKMRAELVKDMHAKVKQIDEARKDNRQYTESEGEARRQLQDLMDNFREESTRLERNWQNRRLANGNLSRNVNVYEDGSHQANVMLEFGMDDSVADSQISRILNPFMGWTGIFFGLHQNRFY